jgi:hypothetical protein
VKSKVNDVIRKRRAAVHPEAIHELVQGTVPRRSHLVVPSATGLADLLHFRDLMQVGGATPRLDVRYEREAWVSRDQVGIRITFDRDVVCSPAVSAADNRTRNCSGNGDDGGGEWIKVCDYPVILEIKFGRALPRWVLALIRRFNLVRTSVPKYVLGTDAARQRGYPIAGRGVELFR